ncbi:MAG: hypothetical protein WAK52_07535, partial [Trichococcus sp.]
FNGELRFCSQYFLPGPNPISYDYPMIVVYCSKATCADDIRAAFFGVKEQASTRLLSCEHNYDWKI